MVHPDLSAATAHRGTGVGAHTKSASRAIMGSERTPPHRLCASGRGANGVYIF